MIVYRASKDDYLSRPIRFTFHLAVAAILLLTTANGTYNTSKGDISRIKGADGKDDDCALKRELFLNLQNKVNGLNKRVTEKIEKYRFEKSSN